MKRYPTVTPMARLMAKQLTQKFIESVKPAAIRKEIPDSALPGLYLLLQPSGSKSWAYRFRHDGRTRKLTLGSWPAVNLAEARKRARNAVHTIGEGKDPAAKVPKREEKTIEELCREFISIYCIHHNRRALGKSGRASLAWNRTRITGGFRLTKSKGEVISRWRNRSVQSITGEDVIDLADAIVARGAKFTRTESLASFARCLFGPSAVNFCSAAIAGLSRQRRNTSGGGY